MPARTVGILLEKAEDHSRCEQVVVESVSISVKLGNKGLETTLIEMIYDTSVV